MKMYSTIGMQDVIKLISAVGHKMTVLVQGEMGCGKSAILKELAELHPDHIPCYMDMTTKDLGDLMLPKMKTIDGMDICTFVPNEDFGLHFNKPVLIMVDEVGKGGKAVMNGILRLIYEQKIGSYSLPEGSIVFATTNLAVEGVGDFLLPHARNRMCVVKMRKHTGDEWRWNYAQHKGIDPVVIATVMEYPAMTASFEDFDRPDMNDYIYDPRVPRNAFVTFRSLEKASDILKACRHMPEDVLTHALMGVIGERATMDMMNILKLDNTMPSWAEIINKPKTTVVPPNGAAVCLLISKGLTNIKKDTIDAWMTYLKRLPKEAQALFAMGAVSPKSPIRPVCVSNKEFTDWCILNNWMF